jgi:DNA-binding response OmpR family regulator
VRPRAILLDVMMPHMDGWAVLCALKADPVLADIPVVMVTMVRQKGLAMTLGAADYLTKPVQWPRLKAVLERYRSSGEPAVALVIEDDEDTRSGAAGEPRRRAGPCSRRPCRQDANRSADAEPAWGSSSLISTWPTSTASP